MKGKSCIYVITNKINGNQYVGQTNNFKRRMHTHCNDDVQVVDKAIKKYGKENFKFEAIHDNIPTEEIDDWEIYYINEIYGTYKNKGYNCHVGGNCQAGEYNPMYGLYGKDNPRYGQKHTLESRNKISKNHHDVNGENNPMYGLRGFKNPKCLVDIEDIFRIINFRMKGLLYREISEKMGLDADLINRICKGNHIVCNQIDFKFDFNLFDELFNHSSLLSVKDAFLIRNLRKDKIPQKMVALLTGCSKGVVNAFDIECNRLCSMVNKDGIINEKILKLFDDFTKQFKEIVVYGEKTITDFVCEFKKYKEWFNSKFDLDYDYFNSYIVIRKRSRLDISKIPKVLQMKRSMTYEELSKKVEISPCVISGLLNGRHWLNDFLTKEGEMKKETVKIEELINKTKTG